MKKIILFLMLSLFLEGCNDDVLLEYPQNQDALVGESYRVHPSEAVATALSAISSVEDAKTRTAQRKVQNINAVTASNMSTRSQNEEDTLLYVVNFQNDEGFAVVSADKRAVPVYAMSDKGHFAINEDSHPALVEFMESAKRDVLNAQNLGDPVVPVTSKRVLVDIKPMLSSYQSQFDICDFPLEHCSCTFGYEPLAIEMICSVLKQPLELENYTYNWDLISEGKDEASMLHFLNTIVTEDYLNCWHGAEDSHGGNVCASEPAIRNTFKKLGFTITENVQHLLPSENDIMEHGDSYIPALEYLLKAPILAKGYYHSLTGPSSYWIIDGVYQYYTVAPQYMGNLYKYYTYYHCVWINHGACNGYFLPKQGFITGKPDFRTEEDGDGSNDGYLKWYIDYNYLQYIGIK